MTESLPEAPDIPDTRRRRAPGMSPEARRQMIVDHALPLFMEHGAGVTTQLIAQTAGIGEATLFRAFEDKAALLRACMQQVMRPESLVEALAGIPLTLPLEERLEAVGDVVVHRNRRIGTVMEALMVAGVRLQLDQLSGQELRKAMHEGRDRSMAIVSEAITELLAPDAGRFRVPVRTAAMSFQFLMMSLMRRPYGGPGDDHAPVGGLAVADVVDLFLHGAIHTAVHGEDL